VETKKKPTAVRKAPAVQAINSSAVIPLLKGLAKVFGGEFIPNKAAAPRVEKPIAAQPAKAVAVKKKPTVATPRPKTARAVKQKKVASAAPVQNVGRPGRTEVKTNVTDLLKARDKKIKALDKELKARKTESKEPVLAGAAEAGIPAPQKKRTRKKPAQTLGSGVFAPTERRVTGAKKQQA
jgi:hypothetical protein